MNEKPELRELVTYPRDAIVDRAQVAAALDVAESVVDKMDLPCFMTGKRPTSARYCWGLVLDELAKRSSPNAPASIPFASRRRA